MDVYEVQVTEPAEHDLSEIARYISVYLNAPTAALNTIQEIRTGINKLKTNALFYPLVRDERLALAGYRSLMAKNYTIFYIVNGKAVDVDRILYGRRDWQNIL